MATHYIVGVDLGTTNSLVASMRGESPVVVPGEDGLDIYQRIKILEVQKKLDHDDPDDRDLHEARCIEQKLDRNLRSLNREINACGDKEHEADLWERYYADKAHRDRIERLLET